MREIVDVLSNRRSSVYFVLDYEQSNQFSSLDDRGMQRPGRRA